MKLRLPRPAEILGLFIHSTSVAHALGELERATQRLEAAGAHLKSRAAAAWRRVDRHRKAAEKATADAAAHHEEALRATRVAERLKSLTA